MRPNNPNKRLRGRNRSKNSNPLARSYESNGPDVKIRGSALQVADKYAQLARDAQSSGDRIMAESYFQHAEHYYRIVAAAYEQNAQQQPRERRDENERNGRYDERGANRGNEQPHVNGFDGVDDDDEGLRRAVRANGSDRSHDGDDDSDGDDEPVVRERATREPVTTNGAVHEAVDEPPARAMPEEAAEAAPASEDDKPKRRQRTSRPRTRTRRAAAGDEAPKAPANSTEASETTS